MSVPGTSLSSSKYLHLGEALLKLPDTLSQIRFLHHHLQEWLQAETQIWFARPFYPLPGESNVPLLDDPDCPPLVKLAAQNHQSFASRSPEEPSATSAPLALALPLKINEDVFGVLLLTRTQQAFTSEEISFLNQFADYLVLALQAFRQIRIKNWRSEQLALVHNITAQITRFGDLKSLCYEITRQIQSTFDLYYVALFILDPSQESLRFCASAGKTGTPENLSDYETIHLGEGIVGRVASTGREIVVRNVQKDSHYRFTPVLPLTLSEVALPLKLGDRVLGVLDLQSEHLNAFHEYDLITFRSVADATAIAFESIRLYENLSRRAERISALLEINHALISILDFDQLMEEVVQAIQKWFGYPFVHLFSVHKGRRKIFYEAGSGARSKAFKELAVSYDLDDPTGIIPWVAREGKIYLANDVHKDPLYRPFPLPPENTQAELAIPLSYGGEVLGVLDLQSDHLNAFDPNDLPYLEALGASIAIAMRNALLYRTEAWRRQVADSFRDIAGLISDNINLSDLLERILSELEHNLPCEASAIWLLDEPYRPNSDQRPALRLAAAHGVPSETLEAFLTEEQEALNFLESALGLTEPQTRRLFDPYEPLGQVLNFPPDYSAIIAPLRAGGQPLGVMILAHRTANRYGSEALLIATTLASYAAVAIQNNRLFASAQEQAWISTILLQIAETSQTIHSEEDLAETFTRLIPLLVGIKQCAFFIWDENHQAFFLKAQHGLPNPPSPQTPFDQRIPAVARLLISKSALIIEDPIREFALRDADLEVGNSAYMVFPLVARDEVLGAILIGYRADHATNREFDPQLIAILQGIAQQASITLENIRLLEARQEEAYVTAALLQVAQAIVSQTSLDDIFETTVHLLPILVGIDACAIFLWEDSSPTPTYRLAKAFDQRHKHEQALEGKRYNMGESPLLDYIYHYDTLIACPINQPDLPIDLWVTQSIENEKPGYIGYTHRVLGIPLSVKGERYGALLVRDAAHPTTLHERRLEIITGIAQQISLAIQNERLTQETVKRERLEREIQVARQIQKTFLPTRLPEHPHWDVRVYWETARQVGGDFYDVIRLSRQRWGLVIGDVSDKGVPAALYMTVARTLIRAFGTGERPSPARVLERVNRTLVFDSPDGLFVTALYAILSLESGDLIYANAGHNLPLVLHANGHIDALHSTGMALGVMSRARIQEKRFSLVPGDYLLFYTDGLTEMLSSQGEIFGEERLIQMLKGAPRETTESLMAHIISTLNGFRQNTPPSDDLTLLLVHFRGHAQEE